MAETSTRDFQNLINYAKYSKFINTVGKRVFLYVHFWLYQGGSQHTCEYLQDVNKKLNGFHARDKETIKNDILPTKMDLTMLYKLNQNVCGLAHFNSYLYSNPKTEEEKEGLEHLLYLINYDRNQLAHQPDDFNFLTESVLDSNFKKLENLYSKILKATAKKASVGSIKLNKAIDTVREELQQIRDLKEFKGLSEEEFVNLGREELRTRINCKASISPKFIIPNLRVETAAAGNLHLQSTAAKIFKLPQLLQQKCEDGSDPNLIIIVGETGAGKSSICENFFQSWTTGSTSAGDLKNFKFVFPLFCRDIATRDWESLLRGHILPKTTSTCDSADFNKMLSTIPILWVVDGWDEATPEAIGLLRSLFNMKIFNHTFLIASRPEHCLSLTGKTLPETNHIKVSICSFEEKDCAALVSCHLQDSSGMTMTQEQIKEFMKCIKEYNDAIRKEFCNPLKLILAAKLWCAEPEKLKLASTLPQLYLSIKEMYIKRLCESLMIDTLFTEREIKSMIESWFRAFCKVSFDMIWERRFLYLSDKDQDYLESECNRLGLKSSKCFSTFLFYGTQANKGNHFYFMHTTQQQFYAALHVCFKIMEFKHEENYIFSIFGINRNCKSVIQNNKVHFFPVLYQVFSLVMTKYNDLKPFSKSIINLLALTAGNVVSRAWFEIVLLCDSEKNLIDEVASVIRKDTWRVEDRDISAANALASRNLPHNIIIELERIGANNPDLECLLNKIAFSNISVNVHYLHFNIFDTSDSYLKILTSKNKKCILQVFLGKLTRTGIEYLKFAKDLKSLGVVFFEPSDIQYFCYVSKYLKRIEDLHIVNYSEQFPILTEGLSCDVGKFGLSLPCLEGKDVSKATEFISGLNKYYYCIYIPQLAPRSETRFTEVLAKNKIKVNTVLII